MIPQSSLLPRVSMRAIRFGNETRAIRFGNEAGRISIGKDTTAGAKSTFKPIPARKSTHSVLERRQPVNGTSDTAERQPWRNWIE
jgi:hypothetical protein